MPAGTNLSTIYTALGTLITRCTGRSWWRKAGIQSQPETPYATVWIQDQTGLQMPVVSHVEYDEELDTGELFHEIPWGTSTLNVQVEFIRSATSNTALDAARRLSQALYLTEREWDLYRVCALSGAVRIIDISGMFRADIEPRARVEFKVVANIIYPEPLADISIYNIETQPILIDEYASDEDKDDVDFTVDDEGERGTWPTT